MRVRSPAKLSGAGGPLNADGSLGSVVAAWARPRWATGLTAATKAAAVSRTTRRRGRCSSAVLMVSTGLGVCELVARRVVARTPVGDHLHVDGDPRRSR